MTATGHALVGAAIASQVPNPLVGLPLALASHFVFDKLPHWDPMTDKNKTKRQIIEQTVLDVLVGFLLVAVIFVGVLHITNPIYIFLAAFTAQLPDWMEAPYALFRMKIPLIYDNYRVQKWVHDIGFDARMKAPWGVVTQAVVVLIFLCWAFRVI